MGIYLLPLQYREEVGEGDHGEQKYGNNMRQY